MGTAVNGVNFPPPPRVAAQSLAVGGFCSARWKSRRLKQLCSIYKKGSSRSESLFFFFEHSQQLTRQIRESLTKKTPPFLVLFCFFPPTASVLTSPTNCSGFCMSGGFTVEALDPDPGTAKSSSFIECEHKMCRAWVQFVICAQGRLKTGSCTWFLCSLGHGTDELRKQP